MRNVTNQIEDIPTALLREPLDWFFAEHYRQRQLCLLIDEIARRTVFEASAIQRVVAFLRSDLPLHVIDEEEDLFPLLRRRALPEDELEDALGILSADHKADMTKAAEVRALLQKCLEENVAPAMVSDGRRILSEFAAQERRHLALENAVVLPIARLRLSPEDLRGLGDRLAARRGILLEEPLR